jgi:hypothetical protein
MKRNVLLTVSFIISLKTVSQNTFPASGNAGIGTTTPGVYALAIQGNNNDGGATNAPGINVVNTSTVLPAGSGYNISWASFSAGNGGILGQFLSNYGVGATAPFNSGTGLYILTRTNHPIIFGTGSATAERMRLTNTGNLGIGTTTPAGVLSFADVTSTSNPVGVTWYSATGDPTLYGIHKTSGAWSAPNYQQIRIGWQTGIVLDPGTAYGLSYVNVVGNGLRVTSGNVGIGTISTNDPNYKLFVETGIRTRKITVDQTAWPDFVFDPAYSLLPLRQLSSFINKNKHLPGVASAAEVESNGVDLGANQAVLLKKLEELTLYIIQQDEKIACMQLQIDKMKKSKR